MTHPAFSRGNVAVVTGGASGIGLASARHFAKLGLKVCIADIGADRLEAARAEILRAVPEAEILAAECDVSQHDALVRLEKKVAETFGGTNVLMNNAATGKKADALEDIATWQSLIEINMWGVIYGSQVFAPAMIASGKDGLIINTGSKQGITTPPGNLAYNVSKAAVKAYTEGLAHQLRNIPDCRISARLLIPGFVFTGMTSGGSSVKPEGAWTSDELVDFMMTRIEAGDFYILCPDNDVPRALDEKRIAWAAGDLIENRPALSRWHPDFAEAFKAFVAG